MEKLNGVRGRFCGTFKRYGSKTNWHGFPDKTVLIIDIKDDKGKIISDHLWINHTKGLSNLGELVYGDVISFDARVTEYIKGYVNHREYIDERTIDYRLSYPTKFKKG